MELMALLKEAGVDTDDLLRRYSGNKSMLERIMRKFPKDPTFSSLRKAVMRRDFTLVELQAHTLRCISANLGFSVLNKTCTKLAAAVRTKNPGKIKSCFFPVEQEYKRLLALLCTLS